MRSSTVRSLAARLAAASLLVLAASCTGTPQAATMADWIELHPKGREFENEDGFWRLSTPGDAGLSEKALRAYLALCMETGADAVLVAKGDAIVLEWYGDRYDPPAHAMSSTKSVASILCGMMRDDGLLAFGDPVGKHLPEWKDGARAGVTIRHLLSQTSGLLRYAKDEVSIGSTTEKNAFARAQVPRAEPGAEWSYSNEGCQLLSPLMEAACGGKLWSYAADRLFRPLGMARTSLARSGSNGDAWTYTDMGTTPRDFARIGAMMLAGGSFHGRRIVSEAYVTEALTPVRPGPGAEYMKTGAMSGYGYLWWLLGDAFAALGSQDNDLYVLPKAGLVIVRMQAVREGYSADQNQTGNYGELAPEILGILEGKNGEEALQDILRRVRPWEAAAGPARFVVTVDLSGMAAPTDSAGAEAALESIIKASAEGQDRSVAAAVGILLGSPALTRSQKARAYSIQALACVRLRKGPEARAAVENAKAAGLAELGGYWAQQLPELEGLAAGL